MTKKLIFILALTTLVAASTISPAFASHRTTVCGDTPNETIATGAFRQVVVPEGATCTLQDVTVERDVVVLEGGRLSLQGTRVGDDLRGRDPASIDVDCRSTGTSPCVEDSFIGDDIVVSGTTSDVDPAGPVVPNRICNTTVIDDLRIEESTSGAPWQIGGATAGATAGSCSRGSGGTADAGGNAVGDEMEIEDNARAITVDSNRISEDLEVEDNTAAVTITNNIIGDDLRCEDNAPAPVASPTNKVGDDARGQCSSGFKAP